MEARALPSCTRLMQKVLHPAEHSAAARCQCTTTQPVMAWQGMWCCVALLCRLAEQRKCKPRVCAGRQITDDELENMRNTKAALNALIQRVGKVRHELEETLDDDQEMLVSLCRIFATTRRHIQPYSCQATELLLHVSARWSCCSF